MISETEYFIEFEASIFKDIKRRGGLLLTSGEQRWKTTKNVSWDCVSRRSYWWEESQTIDEGNSSPVRTLQLKNRSIRRLWTRLTNCFLQQKQIYLNVELLDREGLVKYLLMGLSPWWMQRTRCRRGAASRCTSRTPRCWGGPSQRVHTSI